MVSIWSKSELMTESKDFKRISDEELGQEQIEDSSQLFGEEFVDFWIALNFMREYPECGQAEEFYIPLKKNFNALKILLNDENNRELLEQIYRATSDLVTYRKICLLYEDYCKAMEFDEAEAFDSSFDENLGMESIRVPIFLELNDLLKKAAELMRKFGIDPEAFYKKHRYLSFLEKKAL
jgi:hypothetical protein